MFQKKYPGKLKSFDNIDLFFITNFDHQDKPSAPVLVFNYGLVCSHHHWRYQLEYFDKMNFPILIHDYRGHYNSSPECPVESCHFINFSRDIISILDHLHLEKTVQLGHSMGVNVCLEMATLIPERVVGQILISGTVLAPHDVMFGSNIVDLIYPLWKGVHQRAPNLYKAVWETAALNPLFEKIIHRGGFNTLKTPKSFINTYLTKLSELRPEIFFHLLEEMKNHNILSRLHEINLPSLIIMGDKDKVIPLKDQKVLQETLPQSKTYLVKEGSHVPQVDFPEQVNQRIEVFLKSTLGQYFGE